jgi:chromosomal replication initiator protein
MSEQISLWERAMTDARGRLGSDTIRKVLDRVQLDRLETGISGPLAVCISVGPPAPAPAVLARLRAALEAALATCSGRRVAVKMSVPRRASGVSARVARSRGGSVRIQRAAVAGFRASGFQRRGRSESQSSDEIVRADLNECLCLDSFKCGLVNRVVHRLAQDVARPGSDKANPLVFHGASGVGKTHLLQGIAARVREEREGLRVGYLTAEQFANRFGESLRKRSIGRFRQLLRTLDFLILDDIQLLRGRAKVQEELLFTLDALTCRHRQVVIGCSLPPRRLKGFHPGLVGRMVSGVVVEVGVPDHEARLGIVTSRARACSVKLSVEVCEVLARRYRSNVRELVGAVNKLAAFASLTGKPLDETTVRRILREDSGRPGADGRPSFQDIVTRVGQQLDLEPDDVRGTSRREPVCAARRVAMALSRRHVGATLRAVGEFFSHKSGASVSTAERTVRRLLVTDESCQAAEAYRAVDAELTDLYGSPPMPRALRR